MSRLNLEISSPELIKFGTSSWTYPDWKGSIYKNTYSSEKDFRQNSLREYCSWPIFRTVGIDSSFYGPLSESLIANYSSQVPDDFKWVSKAWERVSIPKYPNQKRYGDLAGRENPDFLNANLFCDSVLEPYEKANKAEKLGAFVFQFPNMKLQSARFEEMLGIFLEALPSSYRYAFELRNKEFLTNSYFNLLRSHSNKATHCFNHWSYMPSLRDQMLASAKTGGLKSDFYVARLLTPLGLSYKEAVDKLSPYREIKTRIASMRRDVLSIAKRAITRKATAYIIINNRLEGFSPGTISEMVQEIAAGR